MLHVIMTTEAMNASINWRKSKM